MSATPQSGRYYDKYWEEGSDTYSGDRQGYAGNFRRWMAAELADLRAPRILEAGCGDGAFTRDLTRFGPVTAIDISAGQIARNAQRLPEVRFRQHDLGEALPFADGTFDVVWCSEVLEHLFDPSLAVKEMRRVLAPGGRLLVTVPYHGPFKNVLIALFKWEEHFAPTGPHIRFFTRKSLSEMVGEAGFPRISVRTCGIGQPLRDRLVATNLLLRAERA